MKSLKILSFFLALFVIGIYTSFAQNSESQLPKDYQEQMATSLKEYFKALGLTDEQKTEFEAITQKYTLQMIAVRDGNESKWKKYKKVKAIRKNKDAEMEELLSDEQYATYQEKQEEMQAKMKARRN